MRRDECRVACHVDIDGDNRYFQMIRNGWGDALREVPDRLGLPQATFASKVAVAGGRAMVTREIDGGLEALDLPLPAVVTTDLRLNEPRYVKLPDIMKAKKKPLESLPFAELGVTAAARVKVVRTEPPAQRQKGIMVKDTQELVAALRKRGVI